MKNKNIWGVLSTQPDQQKAPNAKMRNKMQKKYQTLKKTFLARFAHSAFYKIHISVAADRHAPVQYAKYVFFLSSHHDTNPSLHLYHFRKKYTYLLANIHISVAADRHAPVQYAKYFFSKQSS